MKSRPLNILSIGSYLLAVAGGICGMVTEINEEQVSQHIGQEVIVRGRVTQVARDRGEVFICFGGKYPNQPPAKAKTRKFSVGTAERRCLTGREGLLTASAHRCS